MVTISFTIFSGQKNYNRAHMLFQVLCGLEPIFYTTHPNEEPKKLETMNNTMLMKVDGGFVIGSLISPVKYLIHKIKNWIYKTQLV